MPSDADMPSAKGSAMARKRTYISASACSGDVAGAPISPTNQVAEGPSSNAARIEPTPNASCSVRRPKRSASSARPRARRRAIVEDAASRRARHTANVIVKSSELAATAPRAMDDVAIPPAATEPATAGRRATNIVSTSERNGSISVLMSAGPAIFASCLLIRTASAGAVAAASGAASGVYVAPHRTVSRPEPKRMLRSGTGVRTAARSSVAATSIWIPASPQAISEKGIAGSDAKPSWVWDG